MFIDFNKRKVKRIGIGALVAALAITGAAGYRVFYPGAIKSGADKEAAAESGAVNSQTTNWGLSFQQEGEPPTGNASSEELAKYDAYYCGNPEDKVLYLTFDAGYENGYTPAILDVLKKEKVPAAFFVVGTYIKENPQLIERMEKEGHIVGNHTMNHPDMSAIADEESFKEELQQVEEAYQKATGKKMRKIYRPPQGKFSLANLQMAQKLGYKTAFWSLAYVDWYVDKQPTREEAIEKLMPRTHNGAIILLHSTSKTNGEILQELIKKWKDEGYRFASIDDLGRNEK